MVVMPKQNVPALRLHGFSGEWEDCTLGEHSHVTTGSSDVQDADPDGLYPFFVRSQHVERSNKYLFDGEAILIPGEGRLGEIFHYYIGKFDFHQRVYRISHFEDIDGKYVYWAMQHSFKDHAMQNTVKATVDSLRQPTITGFIFQKPPTLEEQQAIGAIFTNLDAAINQHTLKHKALQQAKTALMQRMFPQEGQTVPELRLEGFSGEWKTTSIGAVSALHNGRDYKHLGEGCIPVYGTGGYMASVDQALSHDKDAVGIGRKGTINKPYILRAPFWTVDTLFYVVPNQDTDLAFFYASVLQVDWMAKNTATGLPSLTSQAINSADISVPPTLEEQQAIGAVFTNLDQLIAAEAQYIASLKQAKTALLQRMFI